MRRRSAAVLLRQSLALAFFPLFVAVCLLQLLGAGAPWRGEWAWTFDNINGATVLLGPVVAAVAGWAVARSRLQGELVDATSRGGVNGLVLAGLVWCSACLALVVCGLGAIAATGLTAHGGPIQGWVLAVGPAVLAAGVSAGALAGRFGPSRIYPLVVGPLIFLLGGAGASGIVPNLLRQGPATTSLAGLAWRPVAMAAETTALLAIAGILVFFGLGRQLRRSVVARSGVAAAVVLLVGALGVRGSGSRFELSAEQPTRCASTAPRVCLAPSHGRALAGVARGFAALVPTLRRAGIAVPDVYAEILPNHRLRPGTGEILLPAQNATSPTVSLADVADWLATPGDCAAYFESRRPPPPEVYPARQLIARWLLSGHGVPDGPDAAAVGPLPPEAWVRSTFAALRTCELGAIALPVPGRG